MKTTIDSTDVKESINMDGTNGSISLKKRPSTGAFSYSEYSDDGDHLLTSQMVSVLVIGRYLKSNGTSLGFKSFKNARLTKGDGIMISDSLSNTEIVKPCVIHKSVHPSDLAKTSHEELDLKSSEILTPYSCECSDCGKLFLSEVNLLQ